MAEGFRKLYPGLAKSDATGRLITKVPATSAHHAGGSLVHVRAHERSGPHGVVHVSGYDRSAPGERAAHAPTISNAADRIRSILNDKPARFEIADNPNETGVAPPWRLETLGLKAVRDYADIVENEAKRQGVDPDMVKAILYYENADGHKLGLDVLADTVGRSRSQRPMSIRSDMWGGLGVSRHSNPAENIRASVTLIRRITDRLDNPTPEKVGTLWNSISREKVTIQGARIGRIYREWPWQTKGPGEPSDSLPLLP